MTEESEKKVGFFLRIPLFYRQVINEIGRAHV